LVAGITGLLLWPVGVRPFSHRGRAQENIIFGWNIIIPATASMIRLSRSLISNSVCRVR
jgi:hypothetical protein